LPGLRGLPDRRRVAGAAADGQRPARVDAADRRYPPARRGRRRDPRPAPGRVSGRGPGGEAAPALAAELLADEKERSEHVMLVDLGRNDLGRVCENGSVHVQRLMEVESSSHVIHIVSQVAGTLRSEVGAIDALRSVLPAGTLSGAPKIRVIEIIDEPGP